MFDFQCTSAPVATAVSTIISLSQSSIADSGTFNIVVPGGTTPLPIFQALAPLDLDWPRWRVYFSDERCLPRDHPDRNDKAAIDIWLRHVPIGYIFSLPAEHGPVEGADQAHHMLSRDQPIFDLVLLGVGADGHVASLFPGRPYGSQSDSPFALAITNAPKPPPERVSLSARCLSATRHMVLIITGREKLFILDDLRGNKDCPANSITARESATVIYPAPTVI
ncbi:6-phosphogluconolactonase [Halorhodospira halochloris]|uniref:6-phosphogluconolactonase n=1 Tax=Halorhodospira halochloris TaxID=1052 RepID=UPI000BBB5275|nr:6-phosphogluconolactonase [Halorhodospira halochloris]MBK1652669.1 6-phosphogluconolactonase [Halorhodospira halochloris]